MNRILSAIGIIVLLSTGGASAVAAQPHGGPVFAYRDRDGYGNGGDDGSGNDQRRCHHAEGDCRGSFSPGPFDRSPVDVHDNCVSLDCSGSGEGKKKDQPQKPQSLIPPSPGAVRDFVVNTVKAGVEMGQLFADATIRFVENLLIGIA